MVEVSVVVPVRDQPTELGLVLFSLGHQREEPPYEVIVVDDGSTPPVAIPVGGYPFPLTVIRQSNVGRAAARNAGVARARGAVVVLLDSDRAPSNHFLARHLRHHERGSRTIVVGDILELYFGRLDNRVADIRRAAARDFDALERVCRRPPFATCAFRIYDAEGNTAVPAPWIAFFSGNVSFRKDHFVAAGGFDESFKEWGFEHYELGLRMHETGLAFRHEPEARTYHFAHRRPAGFYEENLSRGYSRFRAKYPDHPHVARLRAFLNGEISLQVFQHGPPARAEGPPGLETVFYPALVKW
jgi:glycosyltransferase involved in cell wall biosynthesis